MLNCDRAVWTGNGGGNGGGAGNRDGKFAGVLLLTLLQVVVSCALTD